ncbi:ATP-dependent metalloprotease, partial [Francisella tularensis subsp. holarctica]|nr:ATP-dependent metalloprotease [Francisella tularensis subsp. holarctica]
LDGSLVNNLEDSNAIDKAKAPEKPNIFVAFLLNWLPMLLIFGFFIYRMVKAGGGSKGGPFSVGKSKAILLGEVEINVPFDDVAGGG